MVEFFVNLPPTLVAIEAGGRAHHWARLLGAFDHELRLIPPQSVKPYVKRVETDTADARTLCEAVSRPSMRSVPVEPRDHQAARMMVSGGIYDRPPALAPAA